MAIAERLTDQGFGEGIAGLARVLLPPSEVAGALDTITRLAPRSVAGCDSASVFLVGQDARVTTAAASDDEALGVDDMQLEAGEGPCLDAIKSGDQVVVGALGSDPRYPSLGTLVGHSGVFGSCLSVPLTVAGKPVGSLNLYGRRAAAYDDPLPDSDGAASNAARLARQAEVIVVTAMAHDRTLRLGEQLKAAVASRAVIEQAKGIIMARSHVNADAAFERLRQMSQRQNIKLREVARGIVAEVQRAR